MSDAILDTLVGFVEGKRDPKEFELFLQEDPLVQEVLENDPHLPPRTYVGTSVFLFLLQLDLGDPGDVLSAQGAVSEWLSRHSVAHTKGTEAERLYDLLLSAQPEWLHVDTRWLKDELLDKAEGRTGDALRDWLREELLARFRYVDGPPEWIQNPEWPIGPNGPLVFLGQLPVERYFHDTAAVYVFHDPSTGECETITQVA